MPLSNNYDLGGARKPRVGAVRKPASKRRRRERKEQAPQSSQGKKASPDTAECVPSETPGEGRRAGLLVWWARPPLATQTRRKFVSRSVPSTTRTGGNKGSTLRRTLPERKPPEKPGRSVPFVPGCLLIRERTIRGMWAARLSKFEFALKLHFL